MPACILSMSVKTKSRVKHGEFSRGAEMLLLSSEQDVPGFCVLGGCGTPGQNNPLKIVHS